MEAHHPSHQVLAVCQALHFALYVHFYVENQPQRGNCYSHFTGKGTREPEILQACYKWEVGLRVAFCPGLFVSCFLHLFCIMILKMPVWHLPLQ